MLPRLRYIPLRRLVLVVVVALVVGFGAFALTSAHQTGWLGGPPYCTSLSEPGFNFWTGLPRGRVVDCHPGPLSPLAADVVETWATQTDMLGRRAIPVPLGFVIGAFGAAGMLALNDRRRRKDPSGHD